MYFLLKVYKRSFDYIRGLRLYLTIKLCGGRCRSIPRVGKGTIWKYPPHRGIDFGKNVYLGPYCFIDINANANLIIGDNVGITFGAAITSNGTIRVGNDTMIGEYTSIRDSNHGTSKESLIREQPLQTKGEICIGDDVWIGRNALILGGITINRGVVVGANSFVNKNLDVEYGIYWGAPASFKTKRE